MRRLSVVLRLLYRRSTNSQLSWHNCQLPWLDGCRTEAPHIRKSAEQRYLQVVRLNVTQLGWMLWAVSDVESNDGQMARPRA